MTLIQAHMQTPTGPGQMVAFEARYDVRADVLYLRRVDKRGPAARTVASPEGHAIRYDEHGELMGFTLVNARRIIEGAVTLDPAWPISARDLEPALA